MIWILALTACNLGGNTPPRFQTFNDRDVKYIFGFAYLKNPWEPVVVQTGSQWNFEVGVRDSNGDDIELVFPTPPGEIHVDQDSLSGYWEVPEDPLDGTLTWEPRGGVDVAYTDFQVLAVDTQGASDVLFVSLELQRPTTGEVWDTADNYWAETVPKLVGDINIENGFEGSIEWLDSYGRCKITWDQVSGSEIEPCDICESSWSFQLTQGRPETQLASCLESQTFIENTEIQIGFNHAVSWENMDFENTMLFNHPDAGWIPYGDGEIEQERLSFTLYVQ